MVAPRVGDRVVATTRFGGQSELVVVPAANVFPLPDTWSFEEGAAFPVVFLTAHHMLVRVAAAQRGETVLVHAAAGGVGLAVAELARIHGVRVLGLASPAKHDVLRTYGVEPIDRLDPRWPDAVRRLAPGAWTSCSTPWGRLLAPGVRPARARRPADVFRRVGAVGRHAPQHLLARLESAAVAALRPLT